MYLKSVDRKLYKCCCFISCSKSAGCSLKAFGLLLCLGAKQQINCGMNMTSYKCIFVLYSASSSCRSLHAVPCHCLIRALLIHLRLSIIGSGCGKLVLELRVAGSLCSLNQLKIFHVFLCSTLSLLHVCRVGDGEAGCLWLTKSGSSPP